MNRPVGVKGSISPCSGGGFSTICFRYSATAFRDREVLGPKKNWSACAEDLTPLEVPIMVLIISRFLVEWLQLGIVYRTVNVHPEPAIPGAEFGRAVLRALFRPGLLIR